MSAVVALAAGVTEAQIQSALDGLPDGGTLLLPADQIIGISTGLVMNVINRSVTLDLNGSTLQQTGDAMLLYVRGGYAPAQGAALGRDGAGQVTVTTTGTPTAKAGDWVKVYSDSLLPNDHGSATRLGQAMEVVGVDGNTLTLRGDLIDGSLYVDNIRVSKFLSGQAVLENGTFRGDQSHPDWQQHLVNFRATVGAEITGITVRDGNSMGVNIVGGVNTVLSQIVGINLTDDTPNGHYGYAVHSASSINTIVNGLYAERVRHATDDNAVGTEPGNPDPTKYGADIGLAVTNAVAIDTTATAFSWHSEGRLGSVTDSVVFNSWGVMGARGVNNSISDVAGTGNQRGIQFYEYGDGDGRDITVDNVQLRATTYYGYSSIGQTANNTVSNSIFEVFDKNIWVATGITPVNSTTRVIAAGSENAPGLITGTARDDRLLGGGGNDTIQGGDGTDYLWGGNGADLLTGGHGADRFAYLSTAEAGDVITDFQTGAGGDAIDLSAIAIRNGWHGDLFAGGYVTLVQSGADTLVNVDANGGGGFVTLATLRNVTAGAARDNISTEIMVTGTGSASGSSANGNPAPFDPFAGALRVATIGGQLNGSAAHDKMLGSAGADTLNGGGGNDHIYGISPNGGSDGNDMLSGGDGTDYLQGNAGNDTLNGGDGSDRVNGGAGDDRLFGEAGNDHLNGNRGNDLIQGDAGNDVLRGGQGNDTLLGGEDHDTLLGDLGQDQLTGGNGTDIFIFSGLVSPVATPDRITDFTVGVDHVQLGFAPAALLVGASAFSVASGAAQAQALFDGLAGNQEVAAIRVGFDTYLFYASDGGAAVNSAIQLSGVDSTGLSLAIF